MSARTTHPFTRLTGLLVALVTVWCLGCGAFEPLLGFLTDSAAAGMNCGSEQTGGSLPLQGSAAESEHSGSRETQIVTSLDQHKESISCACGSCYSVSPHTLALALEASPAPQAVPGTAPFFESVKREPLVPPPQFIS
jgi:hypothetical protein